LIERGRREFHFALLPHGRDWRAAGLPQAGAAFNHSLAVVPAQAHPGSLPARHAWLEIDPENILLAAAKHAEAGEALVLRLYESGGLATRARLRLPPGFSRWAETNLLEDPAPWQSLDASSLVLPFRPFEVKTILLDR
jgi:alpha-mannosidase